MKAIMKLHRISKSLSDGHRLNLSKRNPFSHKREDVYKAQGRERDKDRLEFVVA
jgi:hypothetical protein